MNFFLSTLFILIVFPIHRILAITISPDGDKRNSTQLTPILINNTTDIFNNQTERQRRLIPYMTFYIPTNDFHLPQSQAYSYMPLHPQQLPQKHLMTVQQKQPQLSPPPPPPPTLPPQQIQPQPQQLYHQHHQQQQQQQQQQRPLLFNLQPKYQGHNNQRPQLSFIFNTRPQPQKQYQVLVQQQPQPQPQQPPQLQQQLQQHLQQVYSNIPKLQQLPTPQPKPKLSLTPFLQSNKLPGYFTPMLQFPTPPKQPAEYNQEAIVAYTVKPQAPIQQQPQYEGEVFSTQRPIYPTNPEQPQEQQKYISYIPQENLYTLVKSTPAPIENQHLYQEKRIPIPINHVVYQDVIDDNYETQQNYQQNQNNLNQQPPEEIYVTHNQQAPVQHVTPAPQLIQQITTSQPIHHQRPPVPSQQLPPKYVAHKGKYGGFIPISVTQAPQTVLLTSVVPQFENVESNSNNEAADHYRDREEPQNHHHHHHHHHHNHHQQQQQRPHKHHFNGLTTPAPRQHLTETTQIQPPALTTYHPSFVQRPSQQKKVAYDSYNKAPKIKTSHRYSSVTKAPIQLPEVSEIPKNVKQIHHSTQKYSTVQPSSGQSNSLADILKRLQDSNHLPQTLTPDNIDNSIRTLIKILNNLKQSQQTADEPPQHHVEQVDQDYDYHEPVNRPEDAEEFVGPNSGRPGIDFPNLSEIPQTSFSCKEQRYKGFFGDPETNCQVWHYCDLNGGQASFLCPNGTIFSQVALTCDWWFNVKCSTTAQLYVLNERLYKYILPFTPKFPEDYNGPLVDKYLAIKFQEMEEKLQKQKKGKPKSQDDADSITGGEDSMNSDTETESTGHEDQSIPYTTTSLPRVTTVTIVPTIPTVRTSVESEKVELIEIKSDGSSGHLIPGHVF